MFRQHHGVRPKRISTTDARAEVVRILNLIEQRLATTPFLAGNALTAADIATVFSLTTMRVFLPFDLSPYPNILAYLQRIGGREAYRRAMKKGDPDLAPMLT